MEQCSIKKNLLQWNFYSIFHKTIISITDIIKAYRYRDLEMENVLNLDALIYSISIETTGR